MCGVFDQSYSGCADLAQPDCYKYSMFQRLSFSANRTLQQQVTKQIYRVNRSSTSTRKVTAMVGSGRFLVGGESTEGW